MPLLRLQNAELAFGHVPLLDGVDLVVEPRERVCLIGRNGAGKSSLLKVIAGEQPLDAGDVWRSDGLNIARLAQEVPDTDSLTLYEVVSAGLGDWSALLNRFHQAGAALAERGRELSEAELDAYGALQSQLEHAGAWEGSQRVDTVLSRLSLPPDARMSECSGGLRRRAMLGRALVGEPDLLLLDEPTNHLDIEAIESLESALLDYPGAVLFIAHDRTLIDHLATRIVELDRGRLRSYPGSFAAYQARKAAELDAEADANRKFDQNLAQEEAWIRQGIKARRTRNEGRVRRLEAMRRERAGRIERSGSVRMNVASGERSGKLVCVAEDVTFAYDGTPVIDHFSTVLLRGDRVGIIGPNGSGKSTLLKLLLGALEPDSGTITRGSRLQVAYFDQERAVLDDERTVRDNLAWGTDQVEINGKSRHVMSYLADFLFPPARANSPVKTLSGGERNRLLLAKLFAQPANLLVLDEPTNDLDMETLELLEELLADYDGTLLLVSHDRSFLDRTVTSTLVLAGDGRVEEHVGGYSDWARFRAEHADAATRPARPAAEAPPPHTARKKKLTYKEQRELESLPEQIEALESRLKDIEARVADPDLYQASRDVITEAMRSLEETQSALQQAYDRWAQLESLQDP
ncbi:MAG: ATP-binding cassette domain-containing protein [Pseudomonadales bacterium]